MQFCDTAQHGKAVTKIFLVLFLFLDCLNHEDEEENEEEDD